MEKVTSKDGTALAFDQSGKGPAVILVGVPTEFISTSEAVAHTLAYPMSRQMPLAPVLVEFFGAGHDARPKDSSRRKVTVKGESTWEELSLT